jgi:DNA polymerase-3 subunit beta
MTSDPDLLSIGDFARAVGLPASALRHYDECGLLVPARTDAATGYRYYTPALEQRARLLAMMRDVGVPIDRMRVVLDGTPAEARAALTEISSDRDEQADRTRAVIGTVLAALDATRVADVVRVEVDGPALAAALRQVRAAADREPGSALASVLVDVRGAQVDVVATNRFWMACRTVEGRAEVAGEGRVLLPLPAAAALADRLEASDDVSLVVGDGRLSIDADGDLAKVDTSAQPFPAHRLVLAGLPASGTTVLVDRAPLLASVTRAGRSLVDLRAGDDGLELDGQPVEAVGRGKPVGLRFRSALLLRAATACVGPRIRLRLVDPGHPVRLDTPGQPGFTALLMPTLEQE